MQVTRLGIAARAMSRVGGGEILSRARLDMGAGHAAEFFGFPVIGRGAAPGAGEPGLEPGKTEAGSFAGRTKTQHAGDKVITCRADVFHTGRIAVRAQIAFDKDGAFVGEVAAVVERSAELVPIGQIFPDARIVFVIRTHDQSVRGELHLLREIGEWIPTCESARGLMSEFADCAGDFQSAHAVNQRDDFKVERSETERSGDERSLAAEPERAT